jgi:hypothetical protein
MAKTLRERKLLRFVTRTPIAEFNSIICGWHVPSIVCLLSFAADVRRIIPKSVKSTHITAHLHSRYLNKQYFQHGKTNTASSCRWRSLFSIKFGRYNFGITGDLYVSLDLALLLKCNICKPG